MKKSKKLLTATASCLGGLLLFSTSVFAHTMPSSETTLIRDFTPTVRAEVKLGDKFSKIHDILGDSFKTKVEDLDFFRRIDWHFYQDSFYTVTSIRNTKSHEELPIYGYDLTSVEFHTPSGFVPSMKFKEVKKKYGAANIKETAKNGNTLHIYTFKDVPRSMTFEVDKKGKVVRISTRTEV